MGGASRGGVLESLCGAGKRLGRLGDVIQLQALPTLLLQGPTQSTKVTKLSSLTAKLRPSCLRMVSVLSIQPKPVGYFPTAGLQGGKLKEFD